MLSEIKSEQTKMYLAIMQDNLETWIDRMHKALPTSALRSADVRRALQELRWIAQEYKDLTE